MRFLRVYDKQGSTQNPARAYFHMPGTSGINSELVGVNVTGC